MCAPYRVMRTGPRHWRVETSSVGLCRRWRRTFWTKWLILKTEHQFNTSV